MASVDTSANAVFVGGVHLNLDGTFGAALIGLVFAAILFGITCVQSFIYFQNSARDSKYMKGMIAYLWSLDGLHIALTWHAVYFYLVSNFTNLLVITEVTWSLCLQVLITVVSNFVIRIYYMRRILIISKRNWFLTSGAVVVNSMALVSGMGFGIKIFSYNSILEIAKLSWLLYFNLGSVVASDVWCAAILCYFLANNRTGFKASDSTVSKLIAYIIGSGLLTSICSICCLASYATMHNYVFLGIYFTLSKLYFNSLLALLNARENLRGPPPGAASGPRAYQMQNIMNIGSSGTSKLETSFGTINVAGTPARNEFNLGDKENQTLAVSVSKETSYHTDDARIVAELDRYKSVLPL